MFAHTEWRLWLATERIARDQRAAAWAHLADEARRRHRLSLRQRTGLALIATGRRLAAEPHLPTRKGLSQWQS